MFFRQILYRDLGCASYVLGDGGEAIVVDPRWDIDVYLELAGAERLRIAHVIDTHDHADHVSGRLRLAHATGARVYRPDAEASSADPGLRADRVARADRAPRAGTIAAGDEIAVGALRLRAIATPGHRPEHLTFTVVDLARSAEPWMLLSGDSLLVGDIARPDLASEAVAGARALHASLERLVRLGDHVEVWPAHVGGSLCGGAGLSGKTSSTVGFEHRNNPLLMMGEEEFVHGLTVNLPSRPPNIERIVALNQRLEHEALAPVAPLRCSELRELLTEGAVVLDARLPEEFDAGHLAGAVNLPVSSPGVGTRAGWAFEPDERIVVVAADVAGAEQMASALQAVGFGKLAGYSLADRGAWERAGLPVAETGSWDLDRLVEGLRAEAVELVDVRELGEWETGHIRGSHHVPLHRLREADTVSIPDRGRTTAVACAAGARAAFAASLLRRAGRQDVVRVSGGGVPDLSAHGIELELGLD